MQSERGLAPGLQRGWDDGSAVVRLREEFPDAVLGEDDFREERTVVVRVESVEDALALLRDDPACAFDYLADVTAVHWPGRERPFEVVYTLYSFTRNVRLRVKVDVSADPRVPTASELWPAANWLERECYDMFGIVFEGHPDLRRLLMTDDFDGYPLRKEFPLKC
ncbi:MAG: NADH-quinone oxidoreductase subunit C [Acidobacteria bacterium]|nr:NADH-quinone oxidoreductase subunit C [Acidobacteriota bacterium]